MRKINNIALALAVAALCAMPAVCQELVYEQRENQVSYNGRVGMPAIAFNGTDFAAFYHWAGNQDTNSGLYMRRLNSDTEPLGPQRKLIDLDTSFSYTYAVWDGSAYIVFIAPEEKASWYIVRVNKKGKVLGQRKAVLSTAQFVTPDAFPFLIGELASLFFSTAESHYEYTPYLLTVDRELGKAPSVTTLPSAGMKEPKIFGVALDPNKFLILLAQISLQNETKQAALVHIGFDGKVKKTVKPSAQLAAFDLFDLVGPVYTGDGYMLAGSRFVPVGTGSFPHRNSSVKIDDTGEITGGPFKVGGGSPRLFGRAFLAGRNVAFSAVDIGTFSMEIMLFGSKGRHIANTEVQESRFSLIPETLNSVYAGDGCATLIYGAKFRDSFVSTFHIYSNKVTDPKSVKPSILYFQDGNGSTFGDTRRHIMWSASSCTNVTLTGPDFELTNLPPVFNYVVDTKGKRTKLKLTITGTDGKTRTKRLVIKP